MKMSNQAILIQVLISILLMSNMLNALKCYSCTERAFSFCTSRDKLKAKEIQCTNNEPYCAVGFNFFFFKNFLSLLFFIHNFQLIIGTREDSYYVERTCTYSSSSYYGGTNLRQMQQNKNDSKRSSVKTYQCDGGYWVYSYVYTYGGGCMANNNTNLEINHNTYEYKYTVCNNDLCNMTNSLRLPSLYYLILIIFLLKLLI